MKKAPETTKISILFLLCFIIISFCNKTNAQSEWTAKGDFGGDVRYGAAGFVIGTKAYIGTGSNGTTTTKDLWEYNTSTNTWTQKADLGGTARSYAVGFAIGSKGYICAGSGSNSLWEYDPTGNTWTQKTSVGSTTRLGATGFVIGSKAYIYGGYNGSSYLSDLYEYDPTSDTWTQKSSFEFNGRAYAASFAIGSKGYIGTGRGNMTLYGDFWEYNPATDTWTQKADSYGLSREKAVGYSYGSKGYIGTGFFNTALKDMWEYDPQTDTWTQQADFIGGVRYGAVALPIETKIFIGTGTTSGSAATTKKDFWEYDPIKYWVIKAGSDGSFRNKAVGFSIGNKGYIGTGYNPNNPAKDFWEIDPATNVWTQKADLGGVERYAAIGFSIGNKGYIGTGSQNSWTQLQDFWEYDPGTNAWTQKANYGGGNVEGAVAFSIGSKGYAGTQSYFNDFWEYDQATDIWTQKWDYNWPGGSKGVGFSIGSKGYAGVAGTKQFWEYDTTGYWTRKADYPGAASEMAVGFSIGNYGFIGTGQSSPGFLANKDFWQYDPKADTWTKKSNYSEDIYSGVGFSIENLGYIVSGVNQGNTSGAIWEYHPEITTHSISTLTYCAGTPVSVSYTKHFTCFTNNTFTAQLSDSSGSFASPINIGSLNDTANGTINAVIPLGTLSGKHYRIRIMSTSPSNISINDNGSDMVIHAIPGSPTVGNDGIKCEGSTINFSSSASTSYSWSGPGMFSSTQQNPVRANVSYDYRGVYTVTITDENGCSNSATTNLDLYQKPAAAATSNSPLCVNATIALSCTPNGMTSYAWSGPSSYVSSSQNPTKDNASAAASGDYIVTMTDNNGCSNTATASVTVGSPVATIFGSGGVCQGASAILSATSGSSYSWNTGSTNSEITISPTVATTYSVSITFPGGCTNSDQLAITINPVPTADAGVDKAVCLGSNTQLVSKGGSLYSWSTMENMSTITVNPITTTTYTVTALNSYGCADADEVVVKIYPIPNVYAGEDQVTFNGGSVTLHGVVTGGTGNYLFNWTPSAFIQSGASTINATTKHLTSSSVFGLSVTDSAGCKNNDWATVYVFGGPLSLTSSATPGSICAAGNSTIAAIASGGSGHYTYSWASSPAGLNDTIVSPVVSPAVKTTYTVTVTDGYYTNTSRITVNVSAAPSTTITPAGATTFCQGGSVQLDAPTGSGYTYVWKKDGQAISGASSSSYTAELAGDYTVVITNSGGCSATSTATTVIVNPAPPAIITASQTAFCEGDSIVLSANSGIGYTYQWKKNVSDIATGINYAAISSGNYSVLVTDGYGCTRTSLATTLTMNALPDAIITAGSDTTFCSGNSVTLFVGTCTGCSYQWKTSGANISGATDPSYMASMNGFYSVAVTNNKACARTSVAKTVTVNPLPIANIVAQGSTSFCVGGSVILKGTKDNSYSYQWKKNNIDIPSAIDSNYTALSGGNYSVEITNTNECSRTSLITSVTASSLPNSGITIIGDTTFCQGSSVNLSVASLTGSAYQWKLNGSNINGAILSSYSASQNGIYSVSINDINNCSNTSRSVIVTANNSPIANAGADQVVFNGGTTTLNGSATGGIGNYTYSWTPSGLINNGASTSIATTKNITASSIFKLAVIDSAGCSNEDWTTILVTGGPLAASVSATPLSICTGSSSSLLALPSGGSGSYTYKWASNPVGTVDSIASIVVYPTITTTYTLTVTDGYYTNTTSVIVSVNSPSNALITPASDTVFCQGGSVILNAPIGSGYTYLWKRDGLIISGENTAVYTAEFSGDYAVQITNNKGCSALSKTQQVIVNNAPYTSISSIGTPNICEGDSITLKANVASSISCQWKKNGVIINGATDKNYNAKIAGKYSVEITDAGGCSGISKEITVITNALPNAIITATTDTTFCQGGSVSLLATTATGNTYQWLNNGMDVNGANNPSFIATTNGLYSVAITNDKGCATTSTPKTITVNTLPNSVISVIGATSLCPGSEAILTASYDPSYSYQWKKDGFDLSGKLDSALNVGTSGNYTVVVTDNNNCSKTSKHIAINANLAPDVSIAAIGDTTFCDGGSVVLTVKATTGSMYQWMKDGSTISGATISSFIATKSGNYSVVVTDGNYCSNTSSLKIVTAKSLPVANTGADLTIFNGATATLLGDASGGAGKYSFAWKPAGLIKSGANTDSATTRNLTASTVFSLTVTDSTGCSDDDYITIGVTGGPLSVSVISNTYTICTISEASLLALPSGGSGNYTYAWSSTPTGFTCDSANPVVSPKVTTTYSVTVNDGYYTQSASIIIAVDSIPTATISVTGSTTICQEALIALNANKGAGLTYQWEKDNQPISGASSSSYNAKQSGDYTVIITNANGCSNKSTKQNVIVNLLPLAEITADSTDICQGKSAILSANASSSFSYQWKKNNVLIANETDSAIAVNSSGNYIVLITDANNCSKASTPISINVHALPNAIITALGNTTFCAGNSVLLNTNTANGYIYQWNKNNSDLANEINSTLNVSDSGSYKVIVTDINNCISTSLPIKTTVVANPDASITTLGKTTMCLGDTVTLSVEGNNNYNYNWKFNGIDLTKEISNSLIITKAGQYSVYIANALTGCASQSTKTNVIVNALPTPTLSSSNEIYACINDTTILSVTNSFSAYSWSNNQKSSTIKVYTTGTYTATVTNSKGCKASAEISVTEQTQAAPEICMVSVSELQDYKNNIVTWDHKQGINIDHFNVYKMDQFSNVYLKIGEVPAAQDGIFSDLASTPAKRSEFYKISMVDICAKETPLSVNHKTMHLMRVPGTDTTIINLIWENYEGMDFNSYTIFRGPDIYHMDTLDYVTNLITSYSDLQLPTYRPIYYNVGINLKSICVDGAKEKATERGPYTMSRSNVEDAGVIDDVGIDDIAGVNGKFSIYPNPVRDELIVKSNQLIVKENTNIIITNALGQIVLSNSLTHQLVNSSTIKLNIQALANGMYYIRIGDVVKKFVVNK